MTIMDGYGEEATVGNARVLGDTRIDWAQKRPIWFQRCCDSNKLIWPLTEAYRSMRVKIKMANQMNLEVDAAVRWLSPQAYTFRLLNQDRQS